MKNLKTIILGIFLISGFSYTSTAQELKTTKILTSATCNACKTRIESSIAYEKGVKDVNVELKSKILTVKYKSNKTSPEKICAAVKKLGYEARIVKKDEKISDHKCPYAGIKCGEEKKCF